MCLTFLSLIYFTLQMSKLIVPIEDHYPTVVTYRGTDLLNKIKALFEQYDLMDMANVCCFKQFFVVAPVKFSGQLLHQLLLKKFNWREMIRCSFRVAVIHVWDLEWVSFLLMTGLSCGASPSEEFFKEKTKARRLLLSYFNNSHAVKLATIKSQF